MRKKNLFHEVLYSRIIPNITILGRKQALMVYKVINHSVIRLEVLVAAALAFEPVPNSILEKRLI